MTWSATLIFDKDSFSCVRSSEQVYGSATLCTGKSWSTGSVSLTRQLDDASTRRHRKSSRRRNNSHTQTTDANFCEFPRRVRPKRAADSDVVGKGCRRMLADLTTSDVT